MNDMSDTQTMQRPDRLSRPNLPEAFDIRARTWQIPEFTRGAMLRKPKVNPVALRFDSCEETR